MFIPYGLSHSSGRRCGRHHQYRQKIPAKYHLEWLNLMLWGGVVMLIVDHVMSGEIVFYPPFLTAMRSSADTAVMLKELATVGTSMTIAIFCVWVIMVVIVNKTFHLRNKKAQSPQVSD